MTLHNSLIYVAMDLVGGEDKSRELLRKIADNGEIIGISSVYKRYLTKEHVDLNARMEFVLRFESAFSVDQQLQLVLSLQEARVHEVTLLAFDSMILMSPRLTLPYPQLHTDPLIIRCAAEAWNHYEHPIYKKTLGELSKGARPAQDAEFFIQGKSLVDF